jgi:predicted transcriptional regulator
MSSLSIRISSETHQKVRDLAKTKGESMQSVIDKAVEDYRRQRFLEEANRQFAVLRADPQAWQEELEERHAWDAVLMDGLHEDEEQA